MTSQEDPPNPVTSNGSRKRPRIARDPEPNVVSCSRCKEKKIKCDNEVPACRPCSRVGSNCIIIDSSTGKQYTRSQIQSLHEQIQELEKKLQSQNDDTDQSRETRPSSGSQTLPWPATQAGHIPKFIGDESGTGFIQYILHAISRGWKDPSFPHSTQEGASGPAVADHPAHPLPSSSEGAKLVTAYLDGFHIQHAFLQRSSVHDLYQRIYDGHSEISPPIIGASPNERRDLFQLNLIFALATVDEYRKERSQLHPFGYFTAGLQNLNGILSFEAIKDVQGFLLIAHFGLYYYIGCSIWEICQICLRICIEQGLYKPSRASSTNLLVEQMRRRIFWSCYQLDRLSSVTLGRPFGIEDADIDIGLPFDAEDDYLEQITQWSDDEASSISGLSSSNGEVAVFNCSIRLGRLACRIHASFNFGIPEEPLVMRATIKSRQRGLSEPGDAYQLFREFFMELRSWRISCPIFLEPQSPSQTQEWFQFMYEREKLTLVRAVIERVHSRASFPPKELLNPYHNTAVAIIHKYDELRQQKQVTYSWSYMQLLLTCGLSVIFCVFVKVDGRQIEHPQAKRSWLSNRWTNLEPETFRDFSLQESSSAIDTCARIHSWMADQSKEMGRYARFFNMMRRGIQEKIKQVESRNHSMAQVEPSSSQRPARPSTRNDQDPGAVPLGHQTATHTGTPLPRTNLAPQLQFENSEYLVPQHNNAFGLLEEPMFDSVFQDQPQSNWSGTDSENAFEPLVRQLFGTDADSDLPNFDFSNMPNDFFTWDFSQDPLLAEFTSGLEGFM